MSTLPGNVAKGANMNITAYVRYLVENGKKMYPIHKIGGPTHGQSLPTPPSASLNCCVVCAYVGVY